MHDSINALMQIGFDEKQAALYIALLQHGHSTVQGLTDLTGIPRSTVRRKLDDLVERGIVHTSSRRNQEGYIAENPERIADIFELQLQELQKRKAVLSRVTHQLNALKRSESEKPSIRYIDSLNGLRMAQRELESMPNDLIQMIGYDTFRQLHDVPESDEHREKLSVTDKRVRAILITDSVPVFPIGMQIESICIPSELAPVSGEISVSGHRVLMFSYIDGLTAVEIRSKSIADTMRATLELAWQRAKEIGVYTDHRV